MATLDDPVEALSEEDFRASLAAKFGPPSSPENPPADSGKRAHQPRGQVQGLPEADFRERLGNLFPSPGGFGGIQSGMEKFGRQVVTGFTDLPVSAVGLSAMLGGPGEELYGRLRAGQETINPPSLQTGDLVTEAIPRALGNVPAILATGGLGEVAGGARGAMAAAGAMGAAQTAPQMYYDVLEKTGDRGKAAVAGLAGAGIGGLEAFGGQIVGKVPLLGKLLGRLEENSGGAIAKQLALRSLGAAGQEAGQEAVSSILQSETYNALTDEDIDVWKQAAQSAEVGGIFGAVFQALTGVPIDHAAHGGLRDIETGEPVQKQKPLTLLSGPGLEQAPGGPGIAQETTSPQMTPEPSQQAQAPSAAEEGPAILQEPGDESFGSKLREITARQEGERRQAFEGERKAYVERLDVVSALVDGEDVPPAVLARYPGAIEQAAKMRERVKAEVEGMGVPYHEELPEKGLRPGETRAPEVEPEAPPKPEQELDIEPHFQRLEEITAENEAAKAETEKALAEAEPKLVHAGIPITGEDIKADIAKLIGRKRDLAEKPDVLGNRQTLAFVRKAVDYLSPHRRAKEARLGKGQEGAVDYVASEELRRGRTRSKTERAERETDRPILKTLRAGKILSEGESDADPGYIRYLTARQARDVNRIVAERQPEVADARKLLDAGDISKADYENIVGHFASGEDIGVGMSNAEADRILASVESGPKAAHYARLAKQFDKLTKETRDLWRRYGLHEESAISAMEKANPNYAPARSDLEEDEALPVGRGLTTRGKESKLRTGRSTLPDDPIAYAIAQRNQAISRGEKNNVLRQWQENIDQNPNFWAGVAKVTKGRTMKAVIDGVVRDVPDPSYGNEKNVVPFKKDGKQLYIEVDKRYSELARALNNADSGMAGSLDHAVRAVGALTRTFAKLRTVYSVEFLATNLARDVGSGVFTSAEEGRRFSRKWAKGIPSAFKELSQWKLSEEGKYPNASLQEYVESGAPVSYLDFKTVKETAKEIESYIKQNEPGTTKKITRAARGTLALLEGASDIVENATRYAAFKAARTEGKSTSQAALIAKNLTVNFERKGELGYVMNSLWAFSSAGIAGSARTLRLLKSPRARRMVIGAVAGMALWDQIGRHLMGEDEDGEDKWDKIPAGLKSRYLVIPKWWQENTDEYLRLPLPPGLSWLLYGGEEVGAALSGKRDSAEAALNVAAALADSFNPLGGGSEKGVHKAAKILAPTVADPLVDLLANKDFAGHTITPDRPGPNAYKFWPDVSETSRVVAQKLEEMTGGDQYEPGAIDISPEHIDFITDYVFGGLGQFMRKAYTTTQALGSDEPVDERNVPILSRFQGKISPWASKQPFDEAIAHMQAEEKRQTGGKALRKNRAPMLEKAFATRREIEKLEEQMDALKEAGDSGAADELAERMDSLRQRFLAQYKARQ